VLRFDPRLPEGWDRLAFPLRFRERSLRVTLTPGRIELLLEEGDPLEVEVRGELVALRVGDPQSRETPPVWLDASEQPPRTVLAGTA